MIVKGGAHTNIFKDTILSTLALFFVMFGMLVLGMWIGGAFSDDRSVTCPDTYTLIKTRDGYLCAREFTTPLLIDRDTGEVIYQPD